MTISWQWHNFQLYRYVDPWPVQYDHIALVKDHITQSPGLLGDTNYWAVAVHMNKSNMPKTPTLDESWGEHKFWYLSSRNSSISLLPWAAARTTGGWPVGDYTEVKKVACMHTDMKWGMLHIHCLALRTLTSTLVSSHTELASNSLTMPICPSQMAIWRQLRPCHTIHTEIVMNTVATIL